MRTRTHARPAEDGGVRPWGRRVSCRRVRVSQRVPLTHTRTLHGRRGAASASTSGPECPTACPVRPFWSEARCVRSAGPRGRRTVRPGRGRFPRGRLRGRVLAGRRAPRTGCGVGPRAPAPAPVPPPRSRRPRRRRPRVPWGGPEAEVRASSPLGFPFATPSGLALRGGDFGGGGRGRSDLRPLGWSPTRQPGAASPAEGRDAVTRELLLGAVIDAAPLLGALRPHVRHGGPRLRGRRGPSGSPPARGAGEAARGQACSRRDPKAVPLAKRCSAGWDLCAGARFEICCFSRILQ